MNNTLLQKINQIIAQITVLRRKLILRKCKDYLGIDFTPLDVIPDEYGCMEAVTTILTQCGVFPGMIPGTWTVNDGMQRRKYKGWVPTQYPQPGDIAIAPTGMGHRGTIGHTWIIGEHGLWYSNDSWTGKWQANYTQKTAEIMYTKEKGIPIFYYTYLTTL